MANGLLQPLLQTLIVQRGTVTGHLRVVVFLSGPFGTTFRFLFLSTLGASYLWDLCTAPEGGQGLVSSLTGQRPLWVESNQPRKTVDVVGMHKKVEMGETRVQIQAEGGGSKSNLFHRPCRHGVPAHTTFPYRCLGNRP